jgi:hypothetical protein
MRPSRIIYNLLNDGDDGGPDNFVWTLIIGMLVASIVAILLLNI